MVICVFGFRCAIVVVAESLKTSSTEHGVKCCRSVCCVGYSRFFRFPIDMPQYQYRYEIYPIIDKDKANEDNERDNDNTEAANANR